MSFTRIVCKAELEQERMTKGESSIWPTYIKFTQTIAGLSLPNFIPSHFYLSFYNHIPRIVQVNARLIM